MANDEGGAARFGPLALEDALDLWREEREKEADAGGHAPREALRRLAAPGGLDRARPEDLAHVSLCPQCLAGWAAAVRAGVGAGFGARAGAGERRGAPVLDYGLLEAAEARGPAPARRLRSRSGSYVLTLSPNVDDPARGLVTLEVDPTFAPGLEGRRVKVHAIASGEVLLDGAVKSGYLARRCEDLAALDLSRGWTVVAADA